MDNFLLKPIAFTTLLMPGISISAASSESYFLTDEVEINTPVQDWLIYSQPVKNYRFQDLVNRVNSFLALDDNWDGYGAEVPDFKVLNNTLRLLDALPEYIRYNLRAENIILSPYGTIVLDWKNGEKLVSVEIGETKIGFFTELNTGSEFSLDGALFNQNSLPVELLAAFKEFSKKNIL